MSGPKKAKTPAEELIESLLKDVGGEAPSSDDDQSENSEAEATSTALDGVVHLDDEENATNQSFLISSSASDSEGTEYDNEAKEEFDSTTHDYQKDGASKEIKFAVDDDSNGLRASLGALQAEANEAAKNEAEQAPPPPPEPAAVANTNDEQPTKDNYIGSSGDSEKTVAVAGYQVRADSDYDDKVKVSVGQNRSGYASWSGGGGVDSNLAQAENLRIAQEKILELEKENEKLRLQNEELMAASEIIKERSDLLSSQLGEYKNDRDGLEESFKNEIVLLKNHLARKDAELQRAQFKTEELDSRLKFDMKKIRIRERELENRLELVRAEKNAIVKNKDEQILDLRRKMDVLQMEVESYRQKCVELNKLIETNQESFKRTTRALRLAMANLELQEENKTPLKKAE